MVIMNVRKFIVVVIGYDGGNYSNHVDGHIQHIHKSNVHTLSIHEQEQYAAIVLHLIVNKCFTVWYAVHSYFCNI